MNKIINAICTLPCVWLIGCATSVDMKMEYAVDINQRSHLNHFFDGYDYVMLETNDSNVVSKIDDFEVNDSIIALQSRSNIFIFDKHGKDIGIINRKGNASNEYLEISDFNLSGDMIWILSAMQKKILAYDLEGNCIKGIDLDNFYYAFEFLNDDRIFLSSENCNDSGYNFVLIDSEDGKVINRFDRFDKNEGVILYKTFNPFIGKTDNNDLIVCHPFESSTYMLSSEEFTPNSSFSFNTETQLRGQYGETPFIDLLNESENQPVVKNLSNYYRNDNYELIAFPLFGEYGTLYNIVKIKDKQQVAFSPILEKIDIQYPYISAPLKIVNGKVISCMQSGQILYIEDNNDLSKFKELGLKNSDNPIVFFHKLRID